MNRGTLLTGSFLILVGIPAGLWFATKSAREAADRNRNSAPAPTVVTTAPEPLAPAPAPVAEQGLPSAPEVGVIDRVDAPAGHESVRLRRRTDVVTVTAGGRVRADDQVLTERDQAVRLVLNDQSVVIVGPSSEVRVEAVLAADGRTALGLLSGTLHAIVNKIYSYDKPFTVAAQHAVMGVRGTEFIAKNDGTGGLQIATLQGSVVLARDTSDLRDPARSVTIAAGTMAQLPAGSSLPTRPTHFESSVLFDSLAKTNQAFVRAIQNKTAPTFAPPAVAPAASRTPPSGAPPAVAPAVSTVTSPAAIAPTKPVLPASGVSSSGAPVSATPSPGTPASGTPPSGAPASGVLPSGAPPSAAASGAAAGAMPGGVALTPAQQAQLNQLLVGMGLSPGTGLDQAAHLTPAQQAQIQQMLTTLKQSAPSR